MSSKYMCRCGSLVRKNIYEGNGLHFLVPEGVTDVDEQAVDVSALLDRIVLGSPVVSTCPNCQRLAIVDETDGTIRFYRPEP